MLAQNFAPEQQRCAIYTRKSVELGLDQEFNSLETQRTICSAYVTSQRHKGWVEISKHYDDGGRSGATLDRPELQGLLADIESGLIDVVLVYKLDRISRTLLDFVRLMDFFECYNVAFISITQNFDTSDSMGRLILNVLLTFAQFEREIMGDRIRDKARLLRQAGRWAGGMPPLGYCVRKRILRVVPSEAQSVRFMFEKFVELGSFSALSRECAQAGIVGRACNRKDPKGRESKRGITPNSSTLNFLLGNPVYIGFIRAGVGNELIAAAHEPLIEKELWDRAQEVRSKIHARRKRWRHKPDLLCKILFDCYGRLMTRHYSCRDDRFNDYYASLQNDWGRRHGQRALWVRADTLEPLVCAALQNLLSDKALVRSGLLKIGCVDRRMEKLTERTDSAANRVLDLKPRDLRELIRSAFVRIELSTDRVKAVVRWREVERYLAWDGKGLFKADEEGWTRCAETHLIDIPFSTTRGRGRSPAASATADSARNPAPQLIQLIHDARKAQALQDESPSRSISQLAKQVRRKDGHFERLLRLNYLAPDIVTAILDGTQPAGLTRKALSRADLPLDWALQRRLLGFSANG